MFNPVPKPTSTPKRKAKRMPSIMQEKKVCYVTGSTQNLHAHEVFFGNPNRDKSLQWGCWVWLRGDWHNQSDYGVHFNRELDQKLKQATQVEFERRYSREKFMEVFGKSYL